MNTLSIREKECLYFLINNDLIGNQTIRKLKSYFETYENIYNADENELKPLLTEAAFERFVLEKNRRNVHADFQKFELKKISFIPYEDSLFPQKLREIPDSPVALLVNGSLPNPHTPAVAIIGARGCTNYGSHEANEYATAIAERGIQIISGMATGIDGIAGNAALRAKGRSFAVLGCGPDVCYPMSNQYLFDSLKEHGGIISEYALGTPGLKWHFPVRNRIISGLCDALLVIEAKEKSGTLITVDCALEQGKDVYALPGRTCDALSIGCNNLIRQGASMLTTPEDFLEDFLNSVSTNANYYDFFNNNNNLTFTNGNKKIVFSSSEEKTIYELLDYNPQSLDEIAFKLTSISDMSLPEIMHHLTNMCIMGIIETISGTNYRKL